MNDANGAVIEENTGAFTPLELDDQEKSILDGYKARASKGLEVEQLAAEVEGMQAVKNRRLQKEYAELPNDLTPAAEAMISNLGKRDEVLKVIRQMNPQQREEALYIAGGLAQKMGKNRGDFLDRTMGAINRGASHGVSQPIQELLGIGGTPEEIEYIRKLDAAAAQEFNPSIPSDPMLERGALQATEMLPWMTTVVGGGAGGAGIAKSGGQMLARGAAAGVPGATTAFKAIGTAGKLPTLVGRTAATTKQTLETAGSLAGITAASFPGQYAQEVDQLKQIGMKDGMALRMLAGGTAAITGLIEGIVPDPFGAGKVTLTQGAAKAAREYLWEAAKKAPGEMTEEYLQGVTSGLGKVVAGYIDENAQDKTITDAFNNGWEQTKEAALPMAFLLGVPAIGGASAAAAKARRIQLEEIRAKGFVSAEDAKVAGIEGKNRKERAANVDAMIEQAKAEEAQASEVEAQGTAQVALPESPEVSTTLEEQFAKERAAGQQTPPPLPDQQQVPPPLPTPAPAGNAEVSDTAVPQPTEAVDPIGERTKIMNTPVVRAKSVTDDNNVRYELFEAEDGKSGVIRQMDMDSGKVVSATKYTSVEKARKEFGRYETPTDTASVDPAASDRKPAPEPVVESPVPTVPATKTMGRKDAPKAVDEAKPIVTTSEPTSKSALPFLTPEWRSNREKEVAEILGLKSSDGEKKKSVIAKMTKERVDEEIALLEKYPPGTQLMVGSYKNVQTVLPDGQLQDGGVNGRTYKGNAGSVLRTYKPSEIKVVSMPTDTASVPAKSQPNWVKFDDNSYGVKINDPDVGDAEATLSYSGDDASLYVDTFGSAKNAPKGSGKKLLRAIVDSAKEYKPKSISGHFTNAAALGALGSEFGKDNVTFKRRMSGKDEDITFEEAMRSPESYIATADLSGKPKKRPTKKEVPKVTQESPQKEVGTNSLGQPVFEDANGVRSIFEGDVRISEKVELRPTRDRGYVPSVDLYAREDRFKTTDEKQPKAKSPDIVSGESQRDEEAKDAPKTKKGGDSNEVEAKERQQGQANANANAKAEAQGQVGDKGGQAAAIPPPASSSSYGKTKPPKGYKPLEEFTPAVTQTLSPDLELQENRDGIKELGLKKGEAVGYRVYPKRGSSKGGYWKYGIVRYEPTGSHASVELEDGTVESVGGARLHRLEPISEQAEKKPMSKWEQGVTDLLSTVPAFKGASFESNETDQTVKVTRPDGLSTVIHFNADADLKEMAKKKGSTGAFGAYVRKMGKKGKWAEGEIYLRSDAGSRTINHEVVHWLQDLGIITEAEIEKHGGREGLADAYGKWVEMRSRPANTLFEKIYDFLEQIFDVDARFFKKLNERVDSTKNAMHYQDGSSYRNWMNRKHRIGDKPTSYLSGHSSDSVRQAAKENPGLGLVITPANPGYVGHGGDYSHVMIDNGAFSEFTGTAPFNEDKFFALLDKVVAAGLKDKVQHVVVPDKVGDWQGTTERWKQFYERVKAYGMPLAYVGQDGIEENTDQIPWDQFDVFFIGGSTPWKLGYDPKSEYKNFNRPTDDELRKAGYNKAFGDLLKEAKRRGKRVHMGRVNSWKRMELANYGSQVDSVDGNFIGAAPDKNLPIVESWLKDTGGDQFKTEETSDKDQVKAGDLIESKGRIGVVNRIRSDGSLSVDFETKMSGGLNARQTVSPRYSESGWPKPGEYKKVGEAPFPATLEQFYNQFGEVPKEQLVMQASDLWNSLNDDDKSRFAHRLRRFGIAGAKKNSKAETLAESIANVITQSKGIPGKLRQIYDIAMEYPKVNNIFEDPEQEKLQREMMHRIDAIGLSLPPMMRAAMVLPEMRREVLYDFAKQQFGKDIADAMFEDAPVPSVDILADVESVPEGGMSVEDFANIFANPEAAPEPSKKRELKEAKPKTKSIEFTEIKQNKTGVTRTVNAFDGNKRLVLELNRSQGSWSIREDGTSKDTVDGIIDLKKAKNVATRILEGTFDVEGDDKFVSKDSTNIGYSNAKLADRVSIGSGEAFAATLKETGVFSDGRVLIRVNDKDKEALLAKLPEPSGRVINVNKLIEDGREVIRFKDNEFAAVAYRGGDVTDRTVFLRNGNGGFAIVDKAYHDTILQKHPTAKFFGSAERYRQISTPVAYSVDGEIVGLVMPILVKRIDGRLKSMIDGTYVFSDQPEVVKPRSVRKDKNKGVEEGLKEASEGFDLIRKGLKKLGSTTFAGNPINADIARGLGMVANGLIKAGKYKFAEFLDEAVKAIGAPAVKYLAPYLEAGWNKKAETDSRLDKAGKVEDYLTKEDEDGNNNESGADRNTPVEDGVGKPDGDASTTSGPANAGRKAKKGSGQSSDPVLSDTDSPEAVDGRDSSGGVGTDGDTNADQSEQGQTDATDSGRGSDDTAVDDQRAANHVIGQDDDIAVSSLTESLARNIDALQLLNDLEAGGRFPNEAERKALAQYTGWGGLSQALNSIYGERMLKEQAWGRDENWEKNWGKAYVKLKALLTKEEFQAAQDSTENAHYTSKPIIQSLWKIAERLGFDGGRVLELGAGVGHFAGLVPSNVRGSTKFVMVERDSVSSRIIKLLYPRHEVVAGDMQQFRAVPGSVTIGIGNVPFAGGNVPDSATRYKEDLNLHNYSIARHLDAVAPGGIVVVISTHNTLDANIKQRKFLASKGELIGAIRLPNNAFAENAKTVVTTDVLIFRRPRQGDPSIGVRFDQNAEITVKNKLGQDVVKSINKYFIENPEMVLGEHSAKGSQYGADEYTLDSTPGSLQSKLDAAIERLPKNILGKVDVAEKVVESDKTIPFGRLEVQNDQVVMGFGDKFTPIEGKKFEEFPVHLTGKTGVARARDYIELRDILKNVRDVMLNETSSDDAVKRAQKQLDASYEKYVSKHGPLNSGKTNIFVRDPDFYRVLALENERSNYNPETKKIDVTYEKASIFTERVLGPQKEPESAESPADAVSVSAAWRGSIDSIFIGKLLGLTPEQAETKLIEEGLAFRNPSTTELELSDLYLSGNVRSKLEQAKISAKEDPQYEKNVEALTKVMPKDVTIKKDTVRLGATWIPEHVINAFASQAFGTEVHATYNANTDAWTVPRVYGISETAKAKYRTERVEPFEVLAETLNLRSIKVYDQIETGEFNDKGKPKTTQVLNDKETQAAKHRASVLRADFEKWVMENADVSDALAKIYNDKYNNFVRTKYNGEFLVLPGANPEIKLRPYQKDAIWRIINRGTALLAHAVGSGKTYTMIGAAMEMRRLGLARRPLLVVQNATLGQFATSFQKMYPNANVLVANKEDLGKGKRQLFLNKVSTGNWDAVVMAQSTFDNMASDPEVERAFIQDQLDLLEEAIREEGGEGEKTPTVKQLVRTKKSLKNRFDSLMGSRAKKEDNVTFEEMGADALFLDEAHAYKKPTFTTKLSQLVGLNVTASARSLATTIKVRSIQSASNGRNVVLATGTPVTNTLGEAWHMVNYVSPATNAAFSSRTFDQFIGNFAQVETTLTMNAGGQYVYKDAIVKFRNGQQLVEYINDSWDIVTPDALRAYMNNNSKGFPTLRDGQPTAITVDRTPGVAAFMDYIARVYDRFKNLPAKQRREMSYIPAIAYGAAKAATLDIRLVVPGAAEEKNSKLQKAANEIKRIYDETSSSKGTQLFFSDMKNPFSMSRLRQFMGGESIDAFEEADVDPDAEEDIASDDNESGSFLYKELAYKLISKGIPAEQIAFIADAKTDKQRQALFERVNNGDIRVLIGSTAKMGVGVNVQNKLAAIHHFDTPWLPADLEQREGRILRFGNENAVVEILRYAMKKTLDGAIYMSTSRKQKFIWQVLNGNLDGDSFEDPSSASMLSIEEQLAAIQDDPVFFEKIDIQNRLRELELERQSFYDAQRRVASSLAGAKSSLDYAVSATIPMQEDRIKRVEKYKADGLLNTFSMVFDGKKLSDPKKAAELLKSEIEELRKYVLKNFDKMQGIYRAGGVLELKDDQKIKFKLGPANVVVGVEPAFVTEEVDGKSVTKSSTRVQSVVYLSEPMGRTYEIYSGNATVPSTLFEKMETLPEDVQRELNRSLEDADKNRNKIKELEGLTGKEWEDQAEYDTKKNRLSDIEAEMLAGGGSLRSNVPAEQKEGEDKLSDKLNDLTDTLYQTSPNDINKDMLAEAVRLAVAAERAGIKTYDQLVAFSVKAIGEGRTRTIGPYLYSAGKHAGMMGVRPTNDILGFKGMTRDQAVTFAKVAFPMLTDEQIEAGIQLQDITAFGRDEIGYAPEGSPVPSQEGNVKGWTSFISATRSIIGATDKANVSTFIHEFFHPMRRFLLDRNVPESKRFGITDNDIKALEDYSGVKDGNWTVEAEEKAAKAWEQYWLEGKSPTTKLDSLFEKISKWMQEVYKGIKQITGGSLPVEVSNLFDKLVQRGLPASERATDTTSGDEGPLTSIKNAIMNELREMRGMPQLADVAVQTQQEWLDEAEVQLRQDPLLGSRLVQELSDNARNLSNIEVAVLQLYYRQMNNQLEEASDKWFTAKDDGDAVQSARMKTDVDLIMKNLATLEEASKKAGREWGRAGVARQIALAKDFSLAAILRKARIANAGNELNEEQLLEMQELAERVAKLEGALEEATQKIMDLERQQNTDKGIEEEKKRVGTPAPKSKSRQNAASKVLDFAKKFAGIFSVKQTGTDTLQQTEEERMVDEAETVVQAYVEAGVHSFGEFIAQVKKDLGGELPMQAQIAFAAAWQNIKAQGDIPSPTVDRTNASAMTRFARKIQRTLVESGITERDEVVEAVRESLAEMDIELSKREVMDALSGYGQFSQLSKDEIDKIIRDINGQLQQLSKIEDMEAGIAPSKTGNERRTPTPAERDLIRKVNELKRTSKYHITDPDAQLKTMIGAAMTAASNRIYDLKQAMAKREAIVKTSVDLNGKDPELDRLRKELAEVTADYKKMFPKPGVTDAQRLAAAVRAVDREIAKIEEQLSTGNVMPKGRKDAVVSDELTIKQARLDSLREMRDTMRMDQDPKYKDKIAEKLYKANLMARIADYQDRANRGYFDPKPKKDPRKLSDEELRLKKELQDAKDEFFRRAGLYRLEHMSPRERAWDWVKETTHLSRAFMTSIDLSAVFRQGGIASFSHPKLASEAAKEMYNAMKSEQAEFKTAEEIRQDKLYDFAIQAGLEITTDSEKITKQEEAYMGRWAKHGFGKSGGTVNKASQFLLTPISASARAYTTFLNSMRFKLFKQFVSTLGADGQLTLDEAKVLASFINVSTGRGDLGKWNQSIANASLLFFAPRYVISRIQYFAMPFYVLPSSKVSGRVKKLIAMEYARYGLGLSLFMGAVAVLGRYLTDDEDEWPTIELDPRSSDFMKIKIGETRIDTTSGLSQIVTFATQVGIGQKKRPDGEIRDMRGEKHKWGDDNTWDVMTDFVRKKFAPVPGAAINVIVRENVVGDEVTPLTAVRDLFIPLSFREIANTMESRDVPSGLVVSALALLGMGGGTYGPKTKYMNAKTWMIFADEAKRKELFEKDLDKMEWNSPNPAYEDFLTAGQLEQVNQRREERKQELVVEALGNPQRDSFLSEDNFTKAVARRDEALKAAKDAGMTYAEVKQLTLDYWKRVHKSPFELRGGRFVMRDAVVARLREARKVFDEN